MQNDPNCPKLPSVSSKSKTTTFLFMNFDLISVSGADFMSNSLFKNLGI
jgi:hypothetical protein